MDDREREQIQDILDYHNSKYGVRIRGQDFGDIPGCR